MSKLKDRYLAKRKAGVIIQDAPPVVEVKQSVWETIGDGIQFAYDPDYNMYCDAIEGMWAVKELFEDIGINADRSYSVAEVTAIRDAIASVLGGGR